MARFISNDPLDKFRWQVSIENFNRLGFYSVETPGFSITTREYSEGGAHLNPRQIIDKISYKPITLSRGVTFDRSFSEWTKEVIKTSRGETEVGNDYRRTVIIAHLNRAGQPIVVYKLFNAFPIEYYPASDFVADSDDGVSIERLVLKYEGFTADQPGLEDSLVSAVFNKGADALFKRLAK